MMSQPLPQHQWLRKFVGAWKFSNECVMVPGEPPQIFTGTEEVRMLGDLWIIAEGRGPMPGGGEMSYIMTVGFDPAKNAYVGSWIGSPMANLFIYEGTLDADGRTLPLNTMGPDFADPTKLAAYQDVHQLLADGRRMMWSQTQGPDKQWHRFMSCTFERTS